jgi:uncharacterized protein YerC
MLLIEKKLNKNFNEWKIKQLEQKYNVPSNSKKRPYHEITQENGPSQSKMNQIAQDLANQLK